MSAETLPRPEVHTASVAWAEVDALFEDLATLTEVRSVRLKGGPLARSGSLSADLVAARAALVSGEAMAVQIRYLHEGKEWLDTLLREDSEVRIVRMAVS